MEYASCSTTKSQQLGLSNQSSISVGGSSELIPTHSVISNENSSIRNGGDKGRAAAAKKKLFGTRKASSGDLSKKMKVPFFSNGNQKHTADGNSINSGNSTKSNNNVHSINSIKNCIPCNGLGCCNINQNLYNNVNGSIGHIVNGHDNGESVELANGHAPVKETVLSQQNWYMCDDDKIKMFTQKEFEDMLQANKKNSVTPYLLFYVRLDNKISPTPFVKIEEHDNA
jgi:hypothetical protein